MKPQQPDQLTLPQFQLTDTPVTRARRTSPPSSPAVPEGAPSRVLRRREVQQLTGLSRTALYRLIQANDFPAQVRLAANTVGWLASEVDAWIVARVAASRTRGAPASARKAGA